MPRTMTVTDLTVEGVPTSVGVSAKNGATYVRFLTGGGEISVVLTPQDVAMLGGMPQTDEIVSWSVGPMPFPGSYRFIQANDIMTSMKLDPTAYGAAS